MGIAIKISVNASTEGVIIAPIKNIKTIISLLLFCKVSGEIIPRRVKIKITIGNSKRIPKEIVK